MYCIHCGIQMEDGTTKCPLCGTVLPMVETAKAEQQPDPVQGRSLSRDGVFWIVTAAALLVAGVILSIDLSMNGKLTWAGYATGGLLLCYMALIVPLCAGKGGMPIIVTAEYGAVALYLLCLERTLGESWFLPVAVPVLAISCLFSVAAALLAARHPTRGLTIAGGMCLAVGVQMMALEALYCRMVGKFRLAWSPWVMLGCGVAGGFLLAVALCPTLREKLIKRMFI